MIYGLGVLYVIEIGLKRRLDIPNVFFYIAFFILIALNYLLVFRRRKQYANPIKPYIVILIIVFGYILMGIGGQKNRHMFINK